MDSGSAHSSVVLLSMHPRYVQAILDGHKRVEFRKAAFRRNVQLAVMYATSPVMKIVGFFEVTKIDKGSPQTVWRRYGKLGSTDEAFFFSYYGSRKSAIAISIGEVTKLERPLSLSEFHESVRPPQSFRYLSRADIKRLSQLHSAPPNYHTGLP